MSKLFILAKQYLALGSFFFNPTRNACSSTSVFRFKNKIKGKCARESAVITCASYFPLHTSTCDRNKNYTLNEEGFIEVNELPKLMEEPIYISQRPGFITHCSNRMKVSNIIRPHIDPEFDWHDFENAAKNATVVASSLLARGDFEHLRELVDPQAFDEIKVNLQKLTREQRLLLEMDHKTLANWFIYDVKTSLDENKDAEEKCLDILAFVSCYKNLLDVPGLLPPLPKSLSYLTPDYFSFVMCNVRFHRNYSKGLQSPWLITFINFYLDPERQPLP